MKAPSIFGAIFEKKVVLKSNSKNSGGKKGCMNDFFEVWSARGGQSRCLRVTFGTFFGDFLDYGQIVRMELSPARELNLEGWRGSEIIRISAVFEDLFQNLKRSYPRCHFLQFFCHKWSKGVPKGSQNPSKVE